MQPVAARTTENINHDVLAAEIDIPLCFITGESSTQGNRLS
jgi:3-deoxy-D-arabino-heptulosonate 7-phosphate (DAHP) synthase